MLWNSSTGRQSVDLPAECQISPLKSISVLDVNGDDIMDIVGIGNHFGAEVETARYDAGYGWVVLGNKSGKLQYNSAFNSGIWLPGDGRSLEVISNGKNVELLAFFNNGKAKSYTLKR